jgi:hypothetical protein
MEYEMATAGSPSDVARIGAEIAYTVAVEKLGLKDVIMYDPSRAGADLITKDGNVVIEARMFQRTSTQVEPMLNDIIKGELIQMVEKIQSDFKAYDSAQIGYVIFSYVDNSGMIHTIVLEVQK